MRRPGDAVPRLESQSHVLSPATVCELLAGLCNLYDVAAAFTASSPLSLANGVLSIDLSAYALASDVPPNVIDATSFNMLVAEGSLFNFSSGVSSPLFAAEVGDYVYDTRCNRIVHELRMEAHHLPWILYPACSKACALLSVANRVLQDD